MFESFNEAVTDFKRVLKEELQSVIDVLQKIVIKISKALTKGKEGA